MNTEKLDAMARLVEEARGHFQEFAGGKKVAATRARKALQEIKRLAQECRNDIQAQRKGPEAGPPAPG